MILPEEAVSRWASWRKKTRYLILSSPPRWNQEQSASCISSQHRNEPRKRSRCFSVGLLTPQTDRHLVGCKRVRGSAVPHLTPTATAWSGGGGYGHVLVNRPRAVTAATLLRDACPCGSGGARAMVKGGGVGARTSISEFMPRLRPTALESRVPVAGLRP